MERFRLISEGFHFPFGRYLDERNLSRGQHTMEAADGICRYDTRITLPIGAVASLIPERRSSSHQEHLRRISLTDETAYAPDRDVGSCRQRLIRDDPVSVGVQLLVPNRPAGGEEPLRRPGPHTAPANLPSGQGGCEPITRIPHHVEDPGLR